MTSCVSADGSCETANLVQGAPCDDGEPCTLGDGCSDGACKGGTNTCGCQVDADCDDEDANPCTGVPYCDTTNGAPGRGAGHGGVCKTNPASVVVCATAADTDCRKNQCDPGTGACTLSAVPKGVSCDDGDPCTQAEACEAGVCAGGVDTCACGSDADCTDDGDLCNGLPYCDKLSGTCQVNPATVVVCNTASDTPCAKTVCVPKTGACTTLARAAVTQLGCVQGAGGQLCLWKPAPQPSSATFACEDGSACTQGDACEGAECKPGKVTCACVADADCPDPDNDACTGVPYCDVITGTCKANPSSVVFCSTQADTACAKATCNPTTGACALAPVAPGSPCDDGQVCTQSGSCDGKGGCVSGPALSCDDNNPCTADACTEVAGCVHSPKDCGDGNACTTDTCEASTGQCKSAPRPTGTSCDADGSGCTVGDACAGGACVAGPALVCVGSVGPCETLACVGKGANAATCVVQPRPDGAACPDAEGGCVVGATCSKGACVAGAQPRFYAKSVGPPKGWSTLRRVARLAGGDLVTVGAHAVSPGAKGGAWWTARWTLAGSQVWSKSSAASAPHAQDGATALTVTPDGLLWVGGRSSSSALFPATVRRRTLNGAMVDTIPLALFASGVAGLCAAPQGGVIALFGVPSGTTTKVYAARYTSDGKLGWTKSLSSNGVPHAVAATQSHVLSLMNYQSGSAMRWGYAFSQQSSGTKIHFQGPGYHSSWTGVAAVARAAGLATLTTDGKGSSSIRLLSGDGLRELDAATVSQGVPSAMAHRPLTAGLWVVGHSGSGGYLAAFDRFANAQWHRAVPNTTRLLGVTDAGEGAVAVGYAQVGAERRARLVRASDFGLASCTGGGLCQVKTHAACDDGKACTADGCDPKSGCVHGKPSGMACDAGDGCSRHGACSAGTCGSADPGRLFNQRYHWEQARGSATDALLALSADVSRIWYTSKSHVRRAEFDPYGSSNSGAKLGLCAGFTELNQVVARAAGSVLVVGTTGPDSAPRAVHCLVDKDGKAQTQQVASNDVTCPTCWSKSRGAAEALDGHLFTVGTVKADGKFKGFVEKRTASGKHVWTSIVGHNAGVGAYDVRPLADGGAGIAGRTLNNGGNTAFIAVVKPDGKERFFTAIPHDKEDFFRAVVQTTSGTLVAAGYSRPKKSGPYRSFVAGVDSKSGDVVWDRWATKVDDAAFFVARALPAGGALLGGWRKVNGSYKALIERIDTTGARVWRREYAGGPTLASAKVTTLGTWSGGYLVGLRLLGSSAAHDLPGLLKTDFGGYAGCKDAGTCLSTKVASCDDSDPCTSDWCDAAAGCKHQAVAGCKAP